MTPFDPNKITFFAKTDARGKNVPFGIKAVDRTKHMYIIGKTGMGKSTLLENMAVQDIRNGEGMAFIDPHGATAETLLDYVPEERKNDVLYFAPFDTSHPVAFNVMEDVGPERRHLVASGLMSVFKKIFVDAWSARMEYILTNTIMALLEYPDSTLLGVNRMLSDKEYRKTVINNIQDPSVKSFWVDEFLQYNERYMQEAGDAIKNKIGQFTANPLIRNIIGQPKSSFDLRKIMDEQKIVIMNLSKGLVGEANANLLGSMLTTRIYLAAMSRADLQQEQLKMMPNFYFYVDEFQSFANATFADILSEARKYKLNLTIAHQYIEQMEEEVKNAVFGNVGTTIAFRVGPFDAEALEPIFMPQFQAIDIVNLGIYQIYLTLMIDGVGSQPFSATTLPPLQKPSVCCKDMIIDASRTQYARPRAGVEEKIIAWHQEQHTNETRVSNGGGQKNVNKQKPREQARPQVDKSEQAHNGKEKSSRDVPERQRKEEKSQSNRESQKEKTPSPKERGGNSLADLRAVLARISTESNSQGSAKKETVVSDSVEESKTAELLERIPKQETQKQGQKRETVHESESAEARQLRETLRNIASTSAPVEKKAEAAVEEKQEETPVPRVIPESSKRDPLDPKKLEHMLRVTTSDRTPFK